MSGCVCIYTYMIDHKGSRLVGRGTVWLDTYPRNRHCMESG